MSYVKGCSGVFFSTYFMKKVLDRKIGLSEGLSMRITPEEIEELFRDVNRNFVNAHGEEEKGKPSGQIMGMVKKVGKTKELIGLAVIRRHAIPDPEESSSLRTFFVNVNEYYATEQLLFDPAYTAEAEYFDEVILDHYKDAIGFGQVIRAEHFDREVHRKERKDSAGVVLGGLGFSLGMFVLWSLIFHNLALGLVFALLFSGSYTVVTMRANSGDVHKKENLQTV